MYKLLLLSHATRWTPAGYFMSLFKQISTFGKLCFCYLLLTMFTLSSVVQAQQAPTGNYANLTNSNGNLFFTATTTGGQAGLWKIDASTGGPTLVKTIVASQLTSVNGTVYFTSNEQETGYELWKSDGTPSGTVKLKDVPLKLPVSEYDYDSDITSYRASIGLTGTENLLYFTVNNAIYDYELWRTDGTAAGTFKVMTVAVYPKFYDEPTAHDFRSVGNSLFFTVTNIGVSNTGIYKTEGDLQSTILIKQAYSPQLLSAVNGIMYFKGESSGKNQLWQTTGTQVGTSLVKDLDLGFQIEENVAAGNNLYFRSSPSSTTGYELWKSDGSAAGTRLVKDIYPGSQDSYPSHLANLNGILYFSAYTDTYGHALWKSDGTEAGTTLVKDPFPGSASENSYNLQLFYLTNVNGTLYFVSRSELGGHILWKSDGTAAGTVKIKDIIGDVSNLINVKGVLYFTADNGSGVKLWKSDGTTSGTVPVESASNQVTSKQWDKTLGGSDTDELSVSIATTDGGYLLAGTSSSGVSGDKSQASLGGNDYWVVKTNSSGTKLWDKRFGTTDNDILTSAIQTTDGGYLLGGYTAAGANGDKSQASWGENDYWIVKISATGVKQWDKRFGGDENDRLFKLLQTPDGGYLLAGLSNSEANGDKSDDSIVGGDASIRNWDDYWLIKVTSTGIIQWDNTVGNYERETNIASLLSTPDGGYLVSGTLYDLTVAGNEDDLSSYSLVKVDSSGEEQWEKHFGGDGEDVLYTVTLTSDGGYLLGGSSNSGMSSSKTKPSIGPQGQYNPADYWIIKLNSAGIRQWDYVFGTTGIDVLSDIVKTVDGGYLLAGYTDGGAEYDKTEASRGETDYWLVKVNSNGSKQWDKRFGGDKAEVLRSALLTSDNGYLLSGYSASGNNGDKSEASKGITDFWLLKTLGTPSVTCSASGSILREVWSNVQGTAVSAIPVNTTPTSSNQLSSFEAPSNVDNSYGQRLRGYICAPTSGNYTFYISADNNAELWLSSDDDPSKKTRIAHITGTDAWTNAKQWTKFASQKSASIALVAGKKYYVEALHKENGNGDNLAVAWILPNTTAITIIPGSSLSPYVPTGSGKIARELWSNVTGAVVSAIPVNTTPTSVGELTYFEAPSNIANSYAQRLRGYLHPQVSGNYTFYIAGDNNCELWLSTDENPAKKVKIAHISGTDAWTAARVWNKYSTQKSVVIALVAGRKYYIEALHKENSNGDNLAVAWSLPSTTTITVIAGTYLSPFTTTNAIARVGQEQELTQTAQVCVYPNPFEHKLSLQTSQAGKLQVNITDNLGRSVYQATHQIEASELEIDFSKAGLKAGLYFVSIRTETGQTKVVRVVKK